MTNTSDICQNCDDAGPRFFLRPNCTFACWFLYEWRGFHRTPYGLAEPGDSGLWSTLSRGTIYTTRTTFETPKYPRRPRDQYTAKIVNTLELSGPHQIQLKKNLSNLVKFQTTNTCTYVAAKNGWTVALWNSLGTCKTSSIPIGIDAMSLEAQLSTEVKSVTCGYFQCWYRSFAMCICINIHGSVVFSVLLPIDIENPHHYWNRVYR